MSKLSKKVKIILVLLVGLAFLGLASVPFLKKKGDFVVRAAVDIGSGATKLKVAKVDLKTGKIDKVLVNESFSVQYQEELEKSKDNKFDEEVMQEGVKALQKSKEIAEKYGATKVVAVATASFRKAENAEEFIDRIDQETGIKVHVVDQDLEGALGFQATAAQFNGSPENMIVWDIGGGSYQFSALNDEGELVVHRGVDASVPFKNRVIEKIKRENPKKVGTPNPLNYQQIDKAHEHAYEISKKVDQIFKEKIADPNTKVIGIGNIFTYRIYPLVENKETFSQKELSEKVYYLEGKRDSDLNLGDYSNVGVTNPILVLGFMNHLGIHEMQVMDINNADGALLYTPFWEDQVLLA